MVTEGIEHAGCARCLHAINLDVWTQALDSEGNAADEAAAADGHDDCLHIGQLIQNF